MRDHEGDDPAQLEADARHDGRPRARPGRAPRRAVGVAAPALFQGWDDVARVAVVAVLAYAALVVVLRVSGKRTLAQLNAFDWVVTVALGSTLASTILSRDVALADGVTALAALVALQFVVAFVSARSQRARRVVTSEPVLLAHRGRLLHDALRRERVSETEVFQALRQHGHDSVDAAEAIVLETNGNFSVVARAGDEGG